MLGHSQKQILELKLTPQQILYLNLLQMPTLQLEQEIREELQQNPFLEEELETITDESLELKRLEENEDVEQTSERETLELEEEKKEVLEDIPANPEEEYTLEDIAKLHEDEEFSSEHKSLLLEDSDEIKWQPPFIESLSDKLIQQFATVSESDREKRIAEEIIGNIDEHGYLSRSIEEIAEDLRLGENLDVTPQEVENVLKKIQRLEPPGIGSRDLKECLLVQLEVADLPEEKKNLAMKILTEAYDDFMKKRYGNIMKQFGLSEQKLNEVIKAIVRLNPKPAYDPSVATEYIVPDFFVERDKDGFIITLNEKRIPTVRLKKSYYDLIRKQNKLSPEEKKEILKQYSRAKWLVEAIHQRRETLLKIMRAIVELQREFFESGEGLKPMIYKDVAKIANVDISTVSRAVNEKYVQTDFGIYKLKEFFSEKINTVGGGEISNKEIKEKIKEIISNEDPRKPYSDEQIAEILKSQGVNIARRTIAKYRAQLGIPHASLRKRIA